jgi:hypothetical protein
VPVANAACSIQAHHTTLVNNASTGAGRTVVGISSWVTSSSQICSRRSATVGVAASRGHNMGLPTWAQAHIVGEVGRHSGSTVHNSDVEKNGALA